jgi:hypothetical protein
MGQPTLMTALHELRGKNLVCLPERCHAEVLIELARCRPRQRTPVPHHLDTADGFAWPPGGQRGGISSIAP